MPASTGFRDLPPRDVLRFVVDSNDAEIELVAAASGRSICLLSLVLSQDGDPESSGSGDGTIALLSDSTEIGVVAFTAMSAPLVLPNNPDGWVQSAPGEGLRLANDGKLDLKGFGSYVLL